MSSLQKNIAQSLLLLTVIPTVIACSKSKFTATQAPPVQPVEQTNNPRYNPTPSTPTYPTHPTNPTKPSYPTHPTKPVPQSECKDYNYNYSNNAPKTVHVWIAMDGSKSQNADERYRQLTGLIETYENVIAREIPIHVGVITGHSAESCRSALRGNNFFDYGETFDRNCRLIGNNNTDLDVLRFDHTQTTRSANFERLRKKITEMATDNSPGISDGGELLTANVMAVIRNNRFQYLMRMQDNDILNIHFIGDENDACTIGEVPSTLPRYARPKADEGGMTNEQIARKRHCVQDISNYSIDMNVSDGGRGYSQTLAQAIIGLSSRYKVHMSAFVYSNPSTIPHTSTEDQNEIGRGIIDLYDVLNKNGVNSRVFDLATLTRASTGITDGDITASAYAAGTEMMTGMNSNFHQRIQMKDENGKAMEVNPAYVQSVRVDGRPVEYQIEQGGYVKLTNGCPNQGNQVTVRYCNRR